jgi:hypothetical protein
VRERVAESVRIWAVDRVEGERVVLVEDASGARVEIGRADLGVPAREGDVLRVPDGMGGAPEWSRAESDADLRRARADEARAAIERLRRRDPGGNLRL